MIRIPKPETYIALLVSEGNGEWTQHAYEETRPCTIPGPGGAAYEFIYKCLVTGAERRWGVAERLETEEGN